MDAKNSRLTSLGWGPVLLLAFLLIGPPAARSQADPFQPSGRFRADFGIDSLERKYYRPQFSLAGLLSGANDTLVFFDLSYFQKINGDLQGPIDFWVKAGAVVRVSDVLSFETSFNHLCRHQTSVFSPRILNINELIGRVWTQGGAIRAGFGFGAFVNSTKGHTALAVLNLEANRFLLPEISFAGEVKWVNFSDLVYEAEMAVTLLPGTDLVVSEIKPYLLPRSTQLSIRLRSTEVRSKLLEAFDLSGSVYPFYDIYKLQVDGTFRLVPFKTSSRRLLFDIAFRSPVLAGTGFWGQFYPDRMMYLVTAEYERPIGRLFGAWYGRYFVDMPVDKDEPFKASAATGLVLRNQPDFNRLRVPLRFEIRAGYDLKYDYDLALKAGINTTGTGKLRAGLEVRFEANGERRAAEGRVFLDFGRGVSLRPFLGLRRITPLAGESASDGKFERILTAGLSFFKWFD